MLHENAHLLRFVMGDKWTDDLVRFFDSEPDPARAGKRRLTVKGEEQAADALSRYFRWKIAPTGRLRAAMDELKDMLGDLWMRGRVRGVELAPRIVSPGGAHTRSVVRDVGPPQELAGQVEPRLTRHRRPEGAPRGSWMVTPSSSTASRLAPTRVEPQ
ncbi:MAG: hypothetical protein FJ090_22890 [Deltaproteobacteria bacterium]|nr:hypothetical protein [Deltaproteobacteria bacterium]